MIVSLGQKSVASTLFELRFEYLHLTLKKSVEWNEDSRISTFSSEQRPISSVIKDVGNKSERVILDEPLDGVREVSVKHLLAVGDLLLVSVIVVLDLQLVHIILRYVGLSQFLQVALIGQVE